MVPYRYGGLFAGLVAGREHVPTFPGEGERAMSASTPRLGLLATLAGAMAAACASPPRPAPTTVAAERARLARLPDDARTLEARWKNLEVEALLRAGCTVGDLVIKSLKVRSFKRPGPKQPLSVSLSDVELRQLPPFDIDRVSIQDGELDYIDTTAPGQPEVWVHDIELALENLSTRPRLSEGLPALLTARATVQRSGALEVFVSADPLGMGVNASGRAAIRGLRTAELFQFLRPSGLQAPEGTIDLFVEFEIKRNRIVGGVKPILKNVEFRPIHDDLGDRWTAFLANLGATGLSDRVPRRNAVATVIPIQGTISDPKAEIWPAVLAVLRNAFQQGISAGFAHVPPPVVEVSP